MKKYELCQSCMTRKRKKHFNAKWCGSCADDRKKRPKSTLDAEQRAFVLAMQGQMSGRRIAEELGTSWSNVMRFARDRGISLATITGTKKYLLRPDLIQAVCDHYAEHGVTSTRDAFPGVNVRSIIDRYKIYPARQTRWTESQLIEIAKMGGLVSFASQAQHFNRPNANEGSIKSAWIKRFGYSGGAIHGMSAYQARYLVKSSCPYVVTRFWHTRRERQEFARKLYLWVDMEKHLKREVPGFIREAIKTLADFQRWLFQSNNPKQKILRLVKEREHSPLLKVTS